MGTPTRSCPPLPLPAPFCSTGHSAIFCIPCPSLCPLYSSLCLLFSCESLSFSLEDREQLEAVVKRLPLDAGDTGDTGLIPGSGRSPGEGNGNPLQCSCLGNPMDRGAWWATGHWVTQSQTCLSTHACPVNSHSKQRLLDRLSDDKVIQARGPPGCQAQEISLNSGPLCTSQRAP